MRFSKTDWTCIEVVEDLGVPAPPGCTIGYKIVDQNRKDYAGYLTHKLSVFKDGEASKTSVIFESQKPRVELLKAMAKIFSTVEEHIDTVRGFFYRSPMDYALLDSYLDQFSGDLEVAAFATFLFHDILPATTNFEELQSIAEAHVANWRLSGVSSREEAVMYWNPATGLWSDYELHDTLLAVEPALSYYQYKEVLDGCQDSHYRMFVKLLYHIHSQEPEMLVDEALHTFSSPTPAASKSSPEGFASIFKLRLDYSSQRDFLRTVTVGDLRRLIKYVDLRRATPASAIALCREWVDKPEHSVALDFTLESYGRFYKAAPHITESIVRERVNSLYVNNAAQHVAIATATEYFENKGESLTPEQVILVVELLFGNLAPSWVEDSYHVNYVLDILKRLGLSAEQIITALKRVSDSELFPTIDLWEKYADRYSEVWDLSIELVLETL